MRTFCTQLARAVGTVLAAILALLVVLAAGETVAWALFEISWASGSEIQGVLLIWFALLGAVYGIHHRTHLGVEILTRLAPPRLRSVLGRLAALLVAIFGALLSFYGAKLALSVTNTLPATGMSASVQYFPAAFCGLLMVVFGACELIHGPAETVADSGRPEGAPTRDGPDDD
ncbi:MAG: TRAP transporter small permease subunit [bacterium]|nr:TRAP transporter small permease subunit [bacterium]